MKKPWGQWTHLPIHIRVYHIVMTHTHTHKHTHIYACTHTHIQSYDGDRRQTASSYDKIKTFKMECKINEKQQYQGTHPSN